MSTPSQPAPSLFGRPRKEVEAELAQREPVSCPLCELVPQPFATDPQGFHLARCPRCGLQFQSPRPPFKFLSEMVYARDYADLSEAAGDLTPERRAQVARQLELLEKYLGKRGSLLDVGCGAGAFLRAGAERGWRVAGTDIQISESAARTGARLRQGRLREIDFDGERFSVVRFHHVLEHTENPLVELSQARSLLEPAGVLYVSVPNLAGLSPRLKNWLSRWRLKAHPWRHYAALHHLWYFTPDTLRCLLERASFRLQHWETPYIPKKGEPAWLGALSRRLLERPGWGSILDVYARPR